MYDQNDSIEMSYKTKTKIIKMKYLSFNWLYSISILLLFFSGSSRYNSDKPNVLFVIFDDLNDYVGAYDGHPQTVTPNLDNLANEGIRFTNAHCNAAWCAPSRVSLLNGFYPHTTQTYRGQTIRETKAFSNVKNIFQHFREHGYNTFGTGKVFHNGHEEDVWTDFGVPTNYGPWPFKNGTFAIHTDMPGEYAKRTDSSQFLSFSRLSNIPNENGYQGWYSDNTPWLPSDAKPFQYKSVSDRDKMPDERSADFAVNVLNQEQNKPFVLAVGIVRPHTPYYLPDEYFERFDTLDINFPPIKENDLEDCVPDLAIFSKHGAKRKLEHILESWPDKAGWEKFMKAYLASIYYADEQFGKVLQALNGSPYAENTIVVVTSDHGYHTGEKNRWFKQTLWERTTRVPLIVKQPGNKNGHKTCSYPVSLIDIFPSLNDLCGLPIQPNASHGSEIEGFSLKPFLDNPDTTEWTGPDVALTSASMDTYDQYHFTVKSERYRYIYTHHGQEELYDHQKDPHEWNNIANNPKYAEVKKDLKDQLFEMAFNK
jgi:arylsulfatase A-like enzyme